MPSADLLIPFFIASAIFACVPGPGMLYAAAQTVALGRRAGWYSAIGFHLAGLGHITAAAFGIATLLDVVPALFTVMKLVGAAYLVWLGIQYLRSPRPPVNPARATSPPPAGKALLDSLAVELLNPKSVLFYVAFVPQFTDTTASLPIWGQVMILGIIVNAMFTVTDVVLIETTDAAARRLRSSERIMLRLRRVGGGVLIALGVNLALTRQH